MTPASSRPEAPLGAAEQDPRPVVRLPRTGLPGAVIAGMAVLLALLLFLLLDGRRMQAVSGATRTSAGQAGAFPPPPPLVVPPEPVPAPAAAAPPVAVVIRPAPAPFSPRVAPPPSPPPSFPAPTAPSPPAPEQMIRPAESAPPRLAEPALVIDVGAEEAGAPGTATAPGGPAGPARPGAPIAGEDTPVRATAIRSRTDIMAVGTLVPAVLETPIDTARPGLVRAIVSRDTRGFDGRRVLVPRGSRLIGEYQSDVRSGQNRVLVTWTRLIRPDGVTIRIGSPAADAMGGAGVPGRVNTFFFQRFASAVLQSALTVGVNLASRPGRGSVIVGLPAGQINNAVGQGLLPANDLRPKITVKSGAALNVFVARDLDFSGVSSGS